jgi:hypothetical protein
MQYLIPTNHLDSFRIQVRRLCQRLERATNVALLGNQHAGKVDLLKLEQDIRRRLGSYFLCDFIANAEGIFFTAALQLHKHRVRIACQHTGSHVQNFSSRKEYYAHKIV